MSLDAIFGEVLGRVLQGVSLLGACAGVIGSFAFLRRRALLGDALAHSTLPGVCIAFLLLGQRHYAGLLAGAGLAGLLGVACVGFLLRFTRLKEDAVIALVLASFYGAGVVLLSIIQQRPGGGQAGIHSFLLGQTASLNREDLLWITCLSLVTACLVFAFRKELALAVFDPAFANVQGWPVAWLDSLILVLIVVAVVIGISSVGIVLIAALLIIPPASARYWTDRLSLMILLSGLIGAVSCITGAIVSGRNADLPAGPCIILAAGLIFALSLAAKSFRNRLNGLKMGQSGLGEKAAVPSGDG